MDERPLIPVWSEQEWRERFYQLDWNHDGVLLTDRERRQIPEFVLRAMYETDVSRRIGGMLVHRVGERWY